MPASKGLLSDVFRAFQAFQRLKKASVPVADGIGAAATEGSELSQACCTRLCMHSVIGCHLDPTRWLVITSFEDEKTEVPRGLSNLPKVPQPISDSAGFCLWVLDSSPTPWSCLPQVAHWSPSLSGGWAHVSQGKCEQNTHHTPATYGRWFGRKILLIDVFCFFF